MRIGFLPNRSAALPQAIRKTICVSEKRDSYRTSDSTCITRQQTDNKSAVKADIFLLDGSGLVDGLIHNGKDGEEGNLV